MIVTKAIRELNLESSDVVYRLLRSGVLRGRKVDGRWEIDADSVEERKRRVAFKRSSKSNAAAERAKRIAEVETMFA
jgi:exopolyphosphatase/pppGpp-phosphohydrolase